MSRREQALKTKKNIFSTAVRLMKNRGYSGTNIRDICGDCGVSIGTFYLYYKNKDDILLELLQKERKRTDKQFPNPKAPSGQTVRPAVLELILHWAGTYRRNLPDPGTPKLFPPHFFHTHIISEDSLFFTRLLNIISTGQSGGTVNSEFSAREICWKLIRFGRGIIYDWLLREREYNFDQVLKDELTVYFRVFETERSQ